MKHTPVLALVLGILLAAASSAQEKTEVPKPEPLKAKLLSVDELAVDAGVEIKLPDTQLLHVFDPTRAGTFYVVAKLRRDLPENTGSNVADLKVQLLLGPGRPVEPYAVALLKSLLDGGKPVYATSEKKRWATEVYYFPLVRGQRDWTLTVNGEAAGKSVDYYATLVIHNMDKESARIKLPDGGTQVIPAQQIAKLQFTSGTHELVLEVRGHGKVKLPWSKFDRTDLKYIAVTSDVRYAPLSPVDKLKEALPKIETAYRMYSGQKGVGGGNYNIGTPGDPVNVGISFGRGEKSGGPWRISADQVTVEYADEATAPKSTGKSKGPRIVKFTCGQTVAAWVVQPWAKAACVDIAKEGREIVGETTAGNFVVRSVERKPSVWDTEGLLSSGILYVKDYGYFDAHARKDVDLFVVYGTKTKEP
jgi:hypothetical protein